MNRTESDLTHYFQRVEPGEVDQAAEQRLHALAGRLAHEAGTTRSPERRPMRLALATAAVVAGVGVSVAVIEHGRDHTVTSTQAAGPVDRAFQARVEATCSTFATYADAHPFPLPDTFDPRHPTAADLRKIATWAARTGGPSRADQWSALHTLGLPDTGTAAWTSILTIIDKARTVSDDQDRAITTTDTARYSADYTRLSNLLTDDLPAALHHAGFAAQDQCYRYFRS